MAQVTITLTDSVLSENSYNADFHVDGTEIDDGHATAAVVVGHYLFNELQTPEFIAACSLYSLELTNQVDGGAAEPSDIPCMVVLTFVDVDLDTGQYKLDIDIGDRQDDRRPTAALFCAMFIRSMLQSEHYVAAIWKHAIAMADERNATINNMANAPGSLANNDGAQEAAAA